MKKFSVVIELTDSDEDGYYGTEYLRDLERMFELALSAPLARIDTHVSHIEASEGSLKEAFGVGL